MSEKAAKYDAGEPTPERKARASWTNESIAQAVYCLRAGGTAQDVMDLTGMSRGAITLRLKEWKELGFLEADYKLPGAWSKEGVMLELKRLEESNGI